MPSKNARLVQALSLRQARARLDWQETETAGVFQLAFPEYAIRISLRSTDVDPDVVISIYDADGRLIDEFADPDLQKDLELPYTQMKDLYDTARRTALGVDRALDALLDELEDY